MESQGHILIIDDNEMNREVLSRRLERQGFTTALAEDGVQGLEMMRGGSYDIILLDIMMPRLNGYQVLEEMKKDEVLKDLPVVVVSAVNELDSVVKCIELGAEDYLFKPFNPVLLRARLRSIMTRKHDFSATAADVHRELLAARQQVDALLNSGAGSLNENQSKGLQKVGAAIDHAMQLINP